MLYNDIHDQSKKVQPAKITLTKREKEVLELIIEGYSTPQISEKLFIAPSTVESHRRNIIDKTGAANSKALIAIALRMGLLD